jgi:proteasome alpha subunit
MVSPYDFNQSIAHRAEYVEERLKGGVPVVGISYDNGVLLFSARRTQRKVFEIYDKLMYSAIGNNSDVEAVRLASIDFAHQEGFARSADDVSIQRLVGFTLSPPLKRSFGDSFNTPNVLRAMFAEVGTTPARDSFFVLNYDGDFSSHSGFAVVAGSEAAEDAMRQELGKESGTDLTSALRRATAALRIGMRDAAPSDEEDATETTDGLQELLDSGGEIEAGILERNSPRESKFRLLRAEEISNSQHDQDAAG